MYANLAEGVEERGFTDVGHADDEHSGAGEGVFDMGVGTGEVKDFENGAFVFVVGEEDR